MIRPVRAVALCAACCLLSWSAPLRAAESCPPSAVVRGPARAAEEMTKALVDRGVRVEPPGLPPGPCGALDVELSEVDGGLRVKIADAWGRTAERDVQSALTAVALVESWARMDLLESAAPATPPVASAKGGAAPARSPLAPVAGSAAPPVPRESDRHSHVLMHLAAERGRGRDHDEWHGINATVCGRIGIVCLGAAARYGESSHSGEGRKKGSDVLMTLDIPIALGRLSLTPGIGAGGGWTGIDLRDLGCKDGSCRGALRGHGRAIALDERGPRGEVHLTAALRLFGRLHVEIGGSATAGIPTEQEPDGRVIVRARAGLLWGLP